MMTKKTLFLVLAFSAGIGCKNRNNATADQVPRLEVKKNSVCSAQIFCARAEFWIDPSATDKKITERMDKELKDCFTMRSGKDTLLPLAVERVNYGVKDELVYVLYFEQKTISNNNTIYYNDRFFGMNKLSFNVE